MYWKVLFLIFSFLFSLNGTENKLQQNGITYTFSGGRFGDNLTAYIHAKWISYKYNVPLYYKPFPYSSELKLDEKEIPFSSVSTWHYQKILLMKADTKMEAHSNTATLYICPYFPDSPFEVTYNKEKPSFFIDWTDTKFTSIIKEAVAPKNSLSLIHPPKGFISIAIHIREGGGFDSCKTLQSHPWKLPPFTYYADALKKVLEFLPQKRIYCFLFTDAKEPGILVQKLQRSLPPTVDILFDFRKNGNSHEANVLEDFFSFFLFDIFIRSDSNYSRLPILIHEYAIVATPGKIKKTSNGTMIIDEIAIKTNKGLLQKLINPPSFIPQK